MACACLGGGKKKTPPPPPPPEPKADPNEAGDAAEVVKQMVYVSRDIPEEALAVLKEKFQLVVWQDENQVPRDKLLADVKGASAIICTISDIIDQEVLDSAGENLKIVATMTAGRNNIDVKTCEERGIKLHDVADLCADCTAELTVALLLLVARRLIEGRDAVRNGEWGLWRPMWICGIEMHERTLGILGFGRVGWGVANRMQQFGISRTIYYDKDEHPMAEAAHAEKVSKEEVFSASDFLICSMALSDETRGIVNKEMLDLCKPECVFINTARAGLVVQDDLVEALQGEKLAGVGLDVTEPEPLPQDHPLLGFPNCVITPHMGTATVVTRNKMAFSLTNFVLNNLA